MAGKSIKANYIYNAIYQVLTLLTPLITTPYISRVLQPDGVGTYSFVYSVMSYFLFFAGMGIASHGQREVSYFQDNRKERSRVFWELKCLSFINVSIAMSAYIIMSFIVAGKNLIIYLIMSMYILFSFLDVTWFLAGMEDFGKTVSVNIVTRILDIAFTFTFIKHKTDLALHIAGMTFFSLMGNLWLWRYIPEYVDKPDIKSLRPFRDIKTIWRLFLPSIAAMIYLILDKTMLGIFAEGAFENGYYEQAMRIAGLSLMLVVSLGSVMVPRIGYLFGKKDHEQIQSYMYASYNFVWFLGTGLCLGLAGISDNFVPWFFGAGYEKVSGLLKFSAFLIPAIGIGNITGSQYLIPTKRENTYTLTLVSGAVVNFVLNIILIRMFLSYGAVVASVIAEVVIALVQLYVVRDELSFTRIISSGKKYFAAGIIMLIVLRFMNARLMPSMINTFMMIFTGALTYVIVLLVLHDEFFIDYSMKTLRGIAFRIHRHLTTKNSEE